MTIIILRGPARVLDWIGRKPEVRIPEIERALDLSNTTVREHIRTLQAARLVETLQDPVGSLPGIYTAAKPMPVYAVVGRMRAPKRPMAAEQMRARRERELEQIEREIDKPFKHIVRTDWTLDHRIGVRSVFELAHR